MFATQKCQYALRAMFALARRVGQGPIKIAQIAEEQGIPFRFLEVILGQLKQGGFVESRRGTEGGYLIAHPADKVTVGDIVRFIDGHIYPENGAGERNGSSSSFMADGHAPGEDVLAAVWIEARGAVFAVFDGTTLAQLVEKDTQRRSQYNLHFEI